MLTKKIIVEDPLQNTFLTPFTAKPRQIDSQLDLNIYLESKPTVGSFVCSNVSAPLNAHQLHYVHKIRTKLEDVSVTYYGAPETHFLVSVGCAISAYGNNGWNRWADIRDFRLITEQELLENKWYVDIQDKLPKFREYLESL